MNEDKEKDLLTMIDKDFTVENGILTWVNPDLMTFEVPVGVIEIGVEVFNNSKI